MVAHPFYSVYTPSNNVFLEPLENCVFASHGWGININAVTHVNVHQH